MGTHLSKRKRQLKMDYLFVLKQRFLLGPYIWYEMFDLHNYEVGGMMSTFHRRYMLRLK